MDYSRSLFLIILSCCIFFNNVFASSTSSLQKLLRYALTEDPLIWEAKANIAAAEAQTKVSQAGHYPVISVVNTQVLSQKHKDSSNIVRSRPSLKGQVNLYHWGAIEHSVNRDKHKADYFRYKQKETKEQVGKLVTELYLKALHAKETIVVYKRSLKRHEKMLKNIRSIVSYDEGRAFEIAQAESRLLKEKSIIEQQYRILNVTLSQLKRYTKEPFTEKDLDDPFMKINVHNFTSRYKNSDLGHTPTYQAQKKEFDSSQSDTKAAKARLLPAINLEGELYNKGYNVYLGVSWNIVDFASIYNVEQHGYTEEIARAKLQEILLELEEQSRSSKIDMEQNSRRLDIVHKQIFSLKKIINSTELQFNIAQRSLLDVLNTYKELSDTEVEEINIKNDFRIAALNYLVSQARIADWAGITTINLKL